LNHWKRRVYLFLCFMFLFITAGEIATVGWSTAVGSLAEAASCEGSVIGDVYFGGGQGTEECPYKIATAKHLNNIRLFHNDGAYFMLTDDIDLKDLEEEGITGWEPIGNYASPFNGTFDGGGHKIENLTLLGDVESSTIVTAGLFGATTSGSVIKNVALSNVNVAITITLENGGSVYFGALVGRNEGLVIKSSVDGMIIVNVNSEENCSSKVGGLVGEIIKNKIENAYTSIGKS